MDGKSSCELRVLLETQRQLLLLLQMATCASRASALRKSQQRGGELAFVVPWLDEVVEPRTLYEQVHAPRLIRLIENSCTQSHGPDYPKRCPCFPLLKLSTWVTLRWPEEILKPGEGAKALDSYKYLAALQATVDENLKAMLLLARSIDSQWIQSPVLVSTCHRVLVCE